MYYKLCGPRSDSSPKSRLIWVWTACIRLSDKTFTQCHCLLQSELQICLPRSDSLFLEQPDMGPHCLYKIVCLNYYSVSQTVREKNYKFFRPQSDSSFKGGLIRVRSACTRLSASTFTEFPRYSKPCPDSSSKSPLIWVCTACPYQF